jgi:hydroxyethylthiazole kinase-like uncharacterized protein yjeF
MMKRQDGSTEEVISMKPLSALHLRDRLRRRPDAHKGDAGKVLLIGGASGMAGALVLSGLGSMFSGAGWVQLMMMDPQSAHVMSSHPELMVHDAHQALANEALQQLHPDAVAIGPGLGQTAEALSWVEAAMVLETALVLDADALNVLASNRSLIQQLKRRKALACITPHPGEAARLLGRSSQDVQAHREQSLSDLVELTGCVVVLKGQHSLLASPLHPSVQCMHGNPGMAVGGMGDVLTGCIAALMAQGVHHQLDAWEAACLGVQAHSMAADQLLARGIGPLGMTASEVAFELRNVLNAKA